MPSTDINAAYASNLYRLLRTVTFQVRNCSYPKMDKNSNASAIILSKRVGIKKASVLISVWRYEKNRSQAVFTFGILVAKERECGGVERESSVALFS